MRDRWQAAEQRLGGSVHDWRLDSLLGVGGMASVFGAADRSGVQAALKIMHLDLAQDEALRTRFLREGYVARQVDHPGCVRVIDEAVTEEGEPYFVMELLEGETLQERIRRQDGGLGVDESLAIMEAVLDTLCACHAKGIIHRDVKPGNVFVATDGRIRLLDFGVAQLRERGSEITRAGIALGTPSYMSPEQALGRRDQVDARSDVFSVGATLYAALSGAPLHQGKTEAEAQVLAGSQPAPSLARVAPDLPVAVLALVDKALQWSSTNRYQSAARMGAAVRAARQPAQASRGEPAAVLVAVDTGLELDWEASSLSDRAPAPVAPEGVDSAPSAERAVEGLELEDALTADPSAEGFELDDVLTAEPSTEGSGLEDAITAEPSTVGLELDLEDDGASDLGAALVPAPGPASVPSDGGAADDAQDPAGTSTPDQRQAIEFMFQCLDRLLRTARQYGPAHPETHSRMTPVHDAVTAALGVNPEGLCWKVLPFSFAHEDVVWEPEPPGDIVPYTLSVAGLREVRLHPGVGEGELRELLGAMMIDANSDPTEVATALWEANFAHVQCRVEEELGASDGSTLDDLLGETDDLEGHLQQFLLDHPSAAQRLANAMVQEDIAETAALAITTQREAARSAAEALALDPDTRDRLRAELTMSAAELSERHVAVTLDAMVDTIARRDPITVSKSLAARTKRLIRAGRIEELFVSHEQLLRRLAEGDGDGAVRLSASFVTHMMFTVDSLRHVVRMASEWSEMLGPERTGVALRGLERITTTLGPTALAPCLRILDGAPEGEARELLLQYVRRVSAGHEQRVIEVLPSLRPLLAQQVLHMLLGDASAEVKALARPLLRSSNAVLRCEALAQLAESPERLTQALMELFGGQDQAARLAALDTFRRHRVLSAGPALVREVESAAFRQRPLDEQEKILDGILALNPGRAERLLISLVEQHGLIGDEALDRTRALAARMLGEHADSEEALAALDSASRRRPWNTTELRQVAADARDAVAERRGEPPSGAGGAS